LRARAAVVVAVVLLAALAAGIHWLHRPFSDLARKQDAQYGQQLGKTLSLTAEGYLELDYRQRSEKLRQVVGDMVRFQPVRYVAVLDSKGRVLASATRDPADRRWQKQLSSIRIREYTCRFDGSDTLVVTRPIIARDKVYWQERIGGAVRLVLDVRATNQTLAATRKQFVGIGVFIAALAAALGYLLVWRVMVRPIRRLAGVALQLAGGDFDARANLDRRDETGELGWAFDRMADQIAAMRADLLDHQKHLEQTVAERTEELRLANDRLREEIRDKEAFLRAVSHDLNAPLRNIAGMATMIVLKHRDELSEDALARLQRIQGNVERQSALIDDLLELSRIATRDERPERIDMRELLEGLTDTFDYEIATRNITVSLRGEMPILHAEPNRIRQVFQNLIDNAIKYMHRSEDGAIDIAARTTPSEYVFHVTDNGPGIPADEQERIFTVFRRASAENAPAGKGVGLAVVRAVAAKYGGRVRVQSTAGQGTTFTVTFARKQCSAASVPRESKPKREVACEA